MSLVLKEERGRRWVDVFVPLGYSSMRGEWHVPVCNECEWMNKWMSEWERQKFPVLPNSWQWDLFNPSFYFFLQFFRDSELKSMRMTWRSKLNCEFKNSHRKSLSNPPPMRSMSGAHMSGVEVGAAPQASHILNDLGRLAQPGKHHRQWWLREGQSLRAPSLLAPPHPCTLECPELTANFRAQQGYEPCSLPMLFQL
jgi:hypothetical protein